MSKNMKRSRLFLYYIRQANIKWNPALLHPILTSCRVTITDDSPLIPNTPAARNLPSCYERFPQITKSLET